MSTKQVIRAQKFRFYPTKSQEEILAKTFGAVRFVWNKRLEAFNNLNGPDFGSCSIKELKEIYPWLTEVPYNALEQKNQDWIQTKKQFFSKTRKVKLGRPKFKSKTGKQSFRLSQNGFAVTADGLKLAKLGFVKIRSSLKIQEIPNIKSVTVSKDGPRYFITVLYSGIINTLPKTGRSCGIDLGLTHFYTDNQGMKIENPRFLIKSLESIKAIQRKLSKKKKGSRRFNKLKSKLNKLYYKVRCQREYFLHRESTRLLKNYDTICIEDLSVKNMLQNKQLSKSISDVSWSLFTSLLKSKATWYGKEVITINKYYPSTRICSVCNYENFNLTLADRDWLCSDCGSHHDRDHNAARNILMQGLEIQSRQNTPTSTSSTKSRKTAVTGK
jgi:putative transposase